MEITRFEDPRVRFPTGRARILALAQRHVSENLGFPGRL